MNNNDYYMAKKAAIEAIPEKQIIRPNMPVSIFLQEAENLYYWCQEDKDVLTGAGLDWSLVEDLTALSGALSVAEAMWYENRYGREEVEKELRKKEAQARAIFDNLLHTQRYAFRNDPDLLKTLVSIKSGRQAEIIQGLNNLAMLGSDHHAALEAIHFDRGLLQQAETMSTDMAGLLARVNSHRKASSASRTMRDKAYTLLKIAVDEIRTCGQFVFRRDKGRLKGYYNNYFHRLHRQGPKTINNTKTP